MIRTPHGTHLSADALHGIINGFWRNAKRFGCLLVAGTVHDAQQDFPLTLGQQRHDLHPCLLKAFLFEENAFGCDRIDQFAHCFEPFDEIFRGGIESIPKGQYEAAAMLGFTRLQTFFRIILPQVVKRVIPASSNEVITLVKDTSLAYAMGYMEIMYIAKKQMTTFSSLTPLFLAGAFYFVMATVLTMLFGLAEKKLDYYK